MTEGDLFLLTESVKVLSEARWSVLRGGVIPLVLAALNPVVKPPRKAPALA